MYSPEEKFKHEKDTSLLDFIRKKKKKKPLFFFSWEQ